MVESIMCSVRRSVCVSVSVTGNVGSLWNALYYILKSGDIWYKRETNTAGGYFKLWYSDDAGVTWDDLMTLDLTEDSVIIDLTHQYTHRITGTAYEVVNSDGEILYST